jgi:hypothetical protein
VQTELVIRDIIPIAKFVLSATIPGMTVVLQVIKSFVKKVPFIVSLI